MASTLKFDQWQNTAGTPYGTILQVRQTAKTDTFASTNSGSFLNITGMSVNITPFTTSSRILILVNLGVVHTWGSGRDRSSVFRVTRNGTSVLNGDAAGSRNTGLFRIGSSEADSNHGTGTAFSVVDSPATTSTITYQLAAELEDGMTLYINRTTNDENTSDAYGARVTSTIIAMEIAA